MDTNALFNINYGLYMLTAQLGEKDNGCIINTVMQVTSTPMPVCVVAVNKQNYTHDMLVQSKQFNVSVLTTQAPFALFERFGFQSGAQADKFADYAQIKRSGNRLITLTEHINAWLSFAVTQTMDFGTHTLFRAELVDSAVLNNEKSLSYAHYHKHIKPKPQAAQNKGWRCEICNYVHQDATLPADFICPICKHGASDFVELT